MDSFPHPFASESVEQHRIQAPDSVTCAVLTISDTRTREDDTSGDVIRQHLSFRGNDVVAYEIVPDDADRIRSTLQGWLEEPNIQVIVTNGGTGVTGRDVTFGVITDLIEKPLPGFGELFRMLSWQEIGAAAMLSRATAGVANNTVIFSTPGSTNAVRLAMEKLIGPELAHLVSHATN